VYEFFSTNFLDSYSKACYTNCESLENYESFSQISLLADANANTDAIVDRVCAGPCGGGASGAGEDRCSFVLHVQDGAGQCGEGAALRVPLQVGHARSGIRTEPAENESERRSRAGGIRPLLPMRQRTPHGTCYHHSACSLSGCALYLPSLNLYP
jgi:hypothetical protein